MGEVRQDVGVHLADQQKRLRAKRQAVDVMVGVAAAGRTITYTQLASRISAVNYAPNGSPFSELLCDISRATHNERAVLLSAVVVHQDDALPGPGFYQLARDLGRRVEDQESFHQTALFEVHREYSASIS